MPIPTGCHKLGHLPCKCNSDQGTRVYLPEQQCLAIIHNGFYAPRKTAERSSAGERPARAGASSAQTDTPGLAWFE